MRIKTFELFENEIRWDGKQLHLGGGSYSEIPQSHEDDALIFGRENSEDEDFDEEEDEEDLVKVYWDKKGLYGDFNSHDKYFQDEKELVDYLNKNGYEYVGIDDRD